MDNKTHDWFATLLFNPDKDVSNIKSAGLNPQNTGLKDRNSYIELPEVRQAFSDENGSFREELFNQYYNSVLSTYNRFVTDDFNEQMFSDYVYSPLNLWRDADTEVDTPAFLIHKVPNPTLKSAGITNLFGLGKDTRSMREAAQTQKIYNYDTKQFEDWTPNDDDRRGLFDFWKNPTLVEATWDEDGFHEENGRQVPHYAGMFKLNAEGMPYYETLGDRDASTKNLLHLTDTLTVDGSTWNKYDIFDNDGIDKSAIGTTMNLVASVAPLFIPYVGPVYKWSTIALGLSRALALFGKSGIDLFGDEEKPKLWKYLNNLDAFTGKFENSVSDYGADNLLSYESIGNIIKDSVKQLYQQREVAKIPRYLGLGKQKYSTEFIQANNSAYLGKYGKTFEQALADGDVKKSFLIEAFNTKRGIAEVAKQSQRFNKLSRDMSSMYMALTQSSEIYETMRENDFSPGYTAIGMVAALVGFKKIMDSELGDVALAGLGLDDTKVLTNKWIKENVGRIKTALGNSDTTSKWGKFAAIKSVSNMIANGAKTLSKNPLLFSAGKEALEEVSEEVLQDSIMGILTAVDHVFGDGTGANYLPWENNILERYSAAALGGFIGGTVFAGVELGENKVAQVKSGQITQNLPKTTLQDLQTLIRNGGTTEIINTIDKWTRSGKVASINLSLDVDSNVSNENNTVFKPAAERSESQNDIIGEYLKSYVKSLDSIINDEGLGLTDSQVLNLVLDKDTRLSELSRNGIDQAILDDFTTMLTGIVQTRSELTTTLDKDQGTQSELSAKLQKQQAEIRNFLEGGKKAQYVEEMAFNLNRSINRAFFDSDLHMYATSKGKNLLSLAEAERKALVDSYNEIRKDNRAWQRYAFKAFQAVKENIQPHLTKLKTPDGQSILQYSKQVREAIDGLNESLGQLTPQELVQASQDFRNTALQGLTNDEIIERFDLNPKQHALTEDNKINKIENFISTLPQFKQSVRSKQITKSLEQAVLNPRFLELGIDSDLFLRSTINQAEQLQKFSQLIDVLEQAHQQFGFIDKQTADKVKSIVRYYNNLDVPKFVATIHPEEVFAKLGDSIDVTNFESFIPVDASSQEIVFPESIEQARLVRSLTPEGIPQYSLEFTLDMSDQSWQDNFLNIIEDEARAYSTLDDSEIDLTASVIGDNVLSIPLNPANFRSLVTTEMNSSNVSKWSDLEALDNNNLSRKLLSDEITDDRLSLINRANGILGQVQNNVILDAIDEVSKMLSGESITNLVKSENETYRSLSNLDDYVINNNLTEQQLATLDTALDMVQSILISSVSDESQLFDFNQIINKAKFREGLPESLTFTAEDVNLLGRDLADLKTKTDYLLALHEQNAGSKILNSKKTNIRLNSLLIGLFAGRRLPALNYTNADGEQENFLNFEGLFTEDELLRIDTIIENNSFDNEDYRFTVESLFKLNKAIHEKYQSLSEEAQIELLNTLAGDTYFSKDFSSTSNIKRNTTYNELSGDFKAQYLVTQMVANPEDFQTRFKEVLINNPDTYAPFAGQMLDLEFNWAALHHAEEINDFLERMISQSTNPNIKRGLNPIRNFTYNLGDPGSGKTTAVAWFVKQMLQNENPELKIWAAAPQKITSQKLGNILGIDQNFSKDELFDALLSDSGKEKYQKIRTYVKTGKGDTDFISDGTYLETYFIPEDFVSSVPEVIFIDEITHYNLFEVGILSNLRTQSGNFVKVVALGDPNQRGAELFNKIDINGSIGALYAGPNLNMSVRTDNTTKQDNLYKLSTTLKQVLGNRDSALLNNLSFNAAPFIRGIYNDLKIKYYEDGSVLHGEKVVDVLGRPYIETLMAGLEEGEKIALITDKANSELRDLFQTLDNTKAVIIDEDNVQGAEYKYTVLDITWNPITENTPADDFISELRRAYTLVTRSSVGTIIVDPNKDSFFRNVEKTEISRGVELNREDVSEYSKFVLSALPGEATQTTPITEAPVTPTQEVMVTPEQYAHAQEIRRTQTEERNAIDTSESFLSVNMAAYSEFQFEGNEYEDINGLNNSQSKELNREGLARLKSILLRNGGDIQTVLNSEDAHNIELLNTVYSTFLETYFPSDNRIEGIEKFNDAIARGNLSLKVKTAEEGDIPFNRPDVESVWENPKLGTTLIKLVYRVPLENGRTWDISMGLVGEQNFPPEIATRIAEISKQVATTGQARYIDFRKDTELDKRGVELRSELDFFGNARTEADRTNPEWQKSHSIAEFTKNHPEINISQPFVASKDIQRAIKANGNTNPFLVRSGQQIVLASSDLTMTQDEMYREFLSHIADPVKNPLRNVTPIWVNPIGIDVNQFVKWWNKLSGTNVGNIAKGNHHHLGGYMQGPRFLNVLLGIRNYLTDPTSYNPDRTNKQENWPSRAAMDQWVAKNGYTPEQLSNMATALDIQYFNKFTARELGGFDVKGTVTLRLDNTKLTPQQLGLNKEQLTRLKSEFELKAGQPNQMLEALKSLRETDPKFSQMYDLFNNISENFNLVSSDVLRLFEAGILPPIIFGSRTVDLFTEAYKTDIFKKLVDETFPLSKQFKYGIQINPVNSVDAITTPNGLYRSGLTWDQLFIDSYVGSSRFYLNYGQLNFETSSDAEPIPEVQSTSQPTLSNSNNEVLNSLTESLSLLRVDENQEAFDAIVETTLRPIIEGNFNGSIPTNQAFDNLQLFLDTNFRNGILYDENGRMLSRFPDVVINEDTNKLEIVPRTLETSKEIVSEYKTKISSALGEIGFRISSRDIGKQGSQANPGFSQNIAFVSPRRFIANMNGDPVIVDINLAGLDSDVFAIDPLVEPQLYQDILNAHRELYDSLTPIEVKCI